MIKWLISLCLVAIILNRCHGNDMESDLEYDSEFEDQTNDWINELQAEGSKSDDDLFEQIFETLRNEQFKNKNQEVLEDNSFNWEKENSDKELTEKESNTENDEENKNVQDYEFDEQQTRINDGNFYTDEMRDEIMDKIERLLHDFPEEKTYSNKHGKTCSDFKKSANSMVHFSHVKWTLGTLKIAHLTCKKGYHLMKKTPQYDVCGQSTKYRWAYELEGKTMAPEKCIKGKATSHTDICTTKQCFTTAAYYMNKIDFSVKPCDNFFDYACGRWLKETKVSPITGKVLTYSLLRSNVVKEMAKLLSQPINKEDINGIRKVKTIYQSCMNEDLINRLDGQPLIRFLHGKMSWPVLNYYWNEYTFDLEATLGNLRAHHNNIIFKFIVAKDNGLVALQMWKGRMALPFAYYTDPGYQYIRDAYYELMVNTATMLGAPTSVAYRDMKEVLDFEIELSNHKLNDVDYYTRKTISELNYEFSQINWLRMFQHMMKGSYPVTLETEVQVWDVNYIRNVIDLLDRTSNRVVQNYIMWRFVKHRIMNLSKRFQNEYLKFKKVVFGVTKLDNRVHFCSSYLIHSLKAPTGKMYIDVYFKPSKKKAAKEMFNNIRKGFIHLLETEVNWMDQKTKAYAKEKALAVKGNFGYNEHLYENTTYINSKTASLHTKRTDYFGNVLNILQLESQNEFKTIGKVYNVHTSPFLTRPTMVNAFYSPDKNSITMPAGELQYPFYWGDQYPWSFQYGGVGTILGHELTHGFDNNGRKYDKHGRLYNWWTTASLKEFNKRTQCMANQYSSYYWKTAKENLNGQKTLGENIADNGGIRESYQGYKIWLKSKGKKSEDVEPATGLTNDQMFFVGFANVRCAKYNERAAKREVLTDVHSPGRYRVIGSLQNFQEFSKAFNCPAGSFMNPSKKCIIW